MGELSSALDAPALIERTAMLLAARNRIDAERARTVREAEARGAAEHDGRTTMTSGLRGHGRLSAPKPPGSCSGDARWPSCRPWLRRSPTERSPPSS